MEVRTANNMDNAIVELGYQISLRYARVNAE